MATLRHSQASDTCIAGCRSAEPFVQRADLAGTPAIIAILRGLTPDRADAVGSSLRSAGIDIIEVPLNSPEPYASIAKLSATSGGKGLVGAGTVLDAEQVQRVHDAGGRLIVAPNCDVRVIRAALRLGMTVVPGFATATEAFAALDAGADTLKLFPASSYGPRHLRALREVLPPNLRIYPVGGIGADDFQSWLEAGASGFGCGSELFRPHYTLEDIAVRARRIVDALRPSPPPG